MKTYIAIIQIENQNSDRPCAKNEKKENQLWADFETAWATHG